MPRATHSRPESTIHYPRWSVIDYTLAKCRLWPLLTASLHCMLYAIYAHAYLAIMTSYQNLTSSTDVYLVKFHTDSIWNNRALGLFKQRCPTRKTSTRTRLCSDTASAVADPKKTCSAIYHDQMRGTVADIRPSDHFTVCNLEPFAF